MSLRKEHRWTNWKDHLSNILKITLLPWFFVYRARYFKYWLLVSFYFAELCKVWGRLDNIFIRDHSFKTSVNFHDFWPLPPYHQHSSKMLMKGIFDPYVLWPFDHRHMGTPLPPKTCWRLKWMVPRKSVTILFCFIYSFLDFCFLHFW